MQTLEESDVNFFNLGLNVCQIFTGEMQPWRWVNADKFPRAIHFKRTLCDAR
jgi:hypothetical protein